MKFEPGSKWGWLGAAGGLAICAGALDLPAFFVPTALTLLIVMAAPSFAPKEATSRAPLATLESIRSRRSIFPRDYVDRTIEPEVMKSLIEAAKWAPFHGSRPPWRFVVLGKQSMREMQRLTLAFYDKNWQKTGWANGVHGSEKEYQAWREVRGLRGTNRSRPCNVSLLFLLWCSLPYPATR